jgi:hypothetical protein
MGFVDAYGLTLEGETLLDGQFNVGAGKLSVTQSASVFVSVSVRFDADAMQPPHGHRTITAGADQ